MKNEKKDLKLYNVIFPVWMLILFPAVWLIVLPGNFIIDSLVLVASTFALKLSNKRSFYLKHIFKIFLFGLISDAVGSGFMLLTLSLEWSVTADELYFTLPAVIISAGVIFALNYFFTFKMMETKKRSKLALTFAIATAPYTFLIPTAWLLA